MIAWVELVRFKEFSFESHITGLGNGKLMSCIMYIHIHTHVLVSKCTGHVIYWQGKSDNTLSHGLWSCLLPNLRHTHSHCFGPYCHKVNFHVLWRVIVKYPVNIANKLLKDRKFSKMKIFAVSWFNALCEYLLIFIFAVRGKYENFITLQVTSANIDMEMREKLHTISDVLKVLQDGRAGHVARLKTLTCKLNFAIFKFAVWMQPRKPRKFIDRENFMSYIMYM